MKKIIMLTLGLLMLLGLSASADVQDFVEMEQIVGINGEQVSTVCQDVLNGDYYLRYVYLYAGQHYIAGRVNIVLERREGKFERIRVEFLSGVQGWHMLESHLYVGLTPPRKMAPGQFPYKQESPEGLGRHTYFIDLANLGKKFDRVFFAIHCVVVKVGQPGQYGDEIIPVGQEETAWGFKTAWYPVANVGERFNSYGEPWGTFFPKSPKEWPAYFMANIPTDPKNPAFQCPQPFRLLVEFFN